MTTRPPNVAGFDANRDPLVKGLAIGAQLGQFEIVGQIGAGGTSIVWKGYDKLLDRHVAIKQLLVDQADERESVRERFMAEAELHKRLGHQNKHLIKVMDFVDEPRGLFIVMEFVDGPSLQQLLASQSAPMPARQALGIVAGAALALQTIHERDILHRDLKPSNILLPKAGGLKVCDFGLAAMLGQQEAMDMGSVRYMAPELFNDDPADARADIYSLGMIAYEMLAGRDAFAEAFKLVLRDQRNQALRWMKWHTNPRTQAPSLTSIHPEIPQTLSDLVSRMMHKDPAMRVGSATELLAAIRRHFASPDSPPAAAKAAVGPAAEPVASADPTAPLPRRSRLRLVLAAVLVAQLLAGLGVWAYYASEKRAAAEQVANEARLELQAAHELYRARQYPEAIEAFTSIADDRDDNSTIARHARAGAALAQGRLFMQQGDYGLAHLKFIEADDAGVIEDRDALQRLIVEALSRDSFKREVEEIEAHLDSGNIAEARRRLRMHTGYTRTEDEQQQLDELGARVADQELQQTVERILRSADEKLAAGDGAQALAELQQALDRYESGRLRERVSQVQSAVDYQRALIKARSHESASELSEAVAAYQQATDIRMNDDVTQRIKQLRGRIAFEEGRRLEQSGQRDAARAAYTRSLGHAETREARDAIERLRTTGQRESFIVAGDEAMSSGDYAAALKQYENAAALGDDEMLQQKVQTSQLRAALAEAQLLLQQQRFDEARVALQAVEHAQSHPDVRRMLSDIDRSQRFDMHMKAGDEFRSRSRFGEAQREYRRARQLIDNDEIRQRINDTEYDHLIANARQYIETGSWDTARAMLHAAGEMRPTEEVEQLLAEVQKQDPVANE